MIDAAAVRSRLFGMAYRILGSVSDAEDVVQGAFLRLEERRGESIRDSAAWLSTVTVRLAIDRARAAARERQRYAGPWLPEPIVEIDPSDGVETADDLAIGFLRVLERLEPQERTAMLLHDVFDYTHAEIAEMLGKSEEATRQIAARARQRVRAERPRLAIDRGKAARLVESFIDALVRDDLDALRAILAEDVVQFADGGGRVHAALNPVTGAERVSALLRGVYHKYWRPYGVRSILVNGQPGIGVFDRGRLGVAVAFDFRSDRISAVYAILNPEKLRAKGAHQP